MIPALNLSSLLPFVLTAIALVFGSLLVVKKAASRYFVVDASFEAGEGFGSRHRMSIGGDGEDGAAGDAICAACRKTGTKKCSRCKSVRYCSQTCQSKHWEAEHKLMCKQAKPSDKACSVTSENSSYRRRKSSGSASISLVPARGSCKELREPKKILFPYDEFVKLFNWDKPGFQPCGLLNCGNSCFANVVLQCLTFTRPLVAYLLEKDHSRSCRRKQEDWCFLCELQAHIQRASQSRQPFSPINILSHIPNLGGNLGYGSQEDAHEFMRFAIDTMQSICLEEHGGEKAVDPSTQETTLIQHIFGGHLQSQVTCTKCNMTSNRYENMMDLTVEIHGDAESLEECLEQFTVKEWLDGDNMYKCDGCNDYVKAWKRLTVRQGPNILTIALKRFQSGRFGKLNKRVTFPEELDLSPYMSEDGDGTDIYTLYAVVVHVDMLNASFFGHYICYTKDCYGRWYRIDDCKVTVVDVEEVLSQGAYMLLYSRRSARKEPFVKPVEPARKKHLASRDVDSANVPMIEIENVSSDPISLASNAGSESNSNTGSESSLPLPRDTGHDRLTDTKTDAMKRKEDLQLQVPMEINPLHVCKDSGDVVMKNSELSSLEAESCGGESSNRSSSMQEDTAADAPTDTKYLFLVSPSTSDVQDMEYEEPRSCEEESVSQHFHVQGDAVATPSYAQAQDMECEGPFGTSGSDFNSKQNGSACVIEMPHLSGHTLEPNVGYNFDQNIGMASLNASMPECSDDSGLKSDGDILECNTMGSINGVDKRTRMPCTSEARASLSPLLENGSNGKPKPIFSRGFLDRPTGEKSVAHERRTQIEKPNGSSSTIANGYVNGQAEPKNNSTAVTSGLQFEGGKSTTSNSSTSFSRGFLNKTHRKSAVELKYGQANGRAPAEVALGSGVCSSGISSLSMDVPLNHGENGSDLLRKGGKLRSDEGKSSYGVAEYPSKLMNGNRSQDEHLGHGECNGLAANCNGE